MTFEEWLETDSGKRCASWPVESAEFLRNRLWWAYNAGAQEGPKPTTPTSKAEGA